MKASAKSSSMAAVKETRTTSKKWEIARKHVEGKTILYAEAMQLKEAQK